MPESVFDVSDWELRAYARIKDRYASRGKKVWHHGDCAIYRADSPHCSCGLIHDLKVLPEPQLIFAEFWRDDCISEGGDPDYKPSAEQKAEMEAIMQSFVSEHSVISPTEEQVQARRDAIFKVFGYCLDDEADNEEAA
jgi:hypothetical protein